MSFFGFDTAIPKERPPAGGSRGIFETPDPFAEVAQATARDTQPADEDALVPAQLPFFTLVSSEGILVCGIRITC